MKSLLKNGLQVNSADRGEPTKILNFGSLNLDYVYAVDHMVQPGETLAASTMETFCGGKGLNQSIALARAGAEVYHAGLIGEEGEILRKAVADSGADTSCIETIAGKSGHTIIQVDQNGQNCILLYGGANRSVTREFVDRVISKFDRGDILLLQNEINELSYIIDKAYERGLEIILNPSPYDQNLEGCDFGKISMFLLNEIEGEQITGVCKPEEILDELKERFPGVKVVLTLGGQGAVYQDQERCCRQGIYQVEAVDTTGAGDTFTGYFIASMLQGKEPQQCLTLAAKASAIAVSRAGAAPSIPEREEVLHTDLAEKKEI